MGAAAPRATPAQRVVLVGGDGTLHAAANAPLRRLPELALVPAGRANNIARALGIPDQPRAAASRWRQPGPARPLDALRVATPDRFVYALEAVSAGFQAEARPAYRRRQLGGPAPGPARAAQCAAPLPSLPGARGSTTGRAPLRRRRAALLLEPSLLRLRLRGDPGRRSRRRALRGDPARGGSRRRLVRLLMAAPGAAATSAGRASGAWPRPAPGSTNPLPLVADAVPLGTTTATVTVEPARLRVAAPGLGATA